MFQKETNSKVKEAVWEDVKFTKKKKKNRNGFTLPFFFFFTLGKGFTVSSWILSLFSLQKRIFY